MLSNDEIKKFAVKNQTTELNIVREYSQHTLLGYLYQKKKSENFLFKGGTALRIVYGSPRFSEDLDYTLTKLTGKEITHVIENTIEDMKNEGFEIDSVKYNKTSSGWLIQLEINILSRPVHIELNLSERKTTTEGQFHLISNPYMPPYSLKALKEENIVSEKIDALLKRKKPRDYYDIYYILRSGLIKKPLIEKRKELIKSIEFIDNTKIKMELKAFLPASHWSILTNLKDNIRTELHRL